MLNGLEKGLEKKRVSVITLTYNELETATKPFFKSLYEFTDIGDFELIVVDNASEDGTVQFLKDMENIYNNITVIYNEPNKGYSRGNNDGLKVAYGDYIILVNNDILFTENWLDILLSPFNDSRVGVVSPMTNFCGQSEQLLPIPVTIDDYKEKFDQYIVSKKGCNYLFTNRVIFFCVAFTREVFEKIGYLDGSFSPAWYEDDDYCARVKIAGWKIAIATNCFIYHNHSQTTSKLSTKATKDLFVRNRIIFEQKHKDYLVSSYFQMTPIFIISFNRLDCMKKLIHWLEKANLENIIILDNHSTYLPLLDYLNKLPYKTVFLDKNYGCNALWDCHLFDELIMTKFFVLTDPDVLPIDECPFNIIEHFKNILERYSEIDKVGFSLKTDDLPNDYPNKTLVLEWEKQYSDKFYKKSGLFDAEIDTTFALYRPNRITPSNRIGRGIRTVFPYVARHLPWYSVQETEESRYYKSCQNGESSWHHPENYVSLINNLKKQKRNQSILKLYNFFISKKVLLPFKMMISLLPKGIRRRIKRVLFKRLLA